MRIWIWVLLLSSAIAWQQRYEIRDFFDPPEPIVVADGAVVLYGTSWCGYCAKTRALFRARNIPFQDVDIEESADGEAQYRRLGGRGVPLVVINGTVIYGYDRAAIEDALAKM